MDSSLSHIRLAFLTALFHTFERQTRKFTKTDYYAREAAMKMLAPRGIHLDEARMHELHVAVNAAKHGPGKAMAELATLRPDLIDDGEVNVSPEQLEEFFDLFRQMHS